MSKLSALFAAVLIVTACGGSSGDAVDAPGTDPSGDATVATPAPPSSETPAPTEAPTPTEAPAESGDAGTGNPMMVPAGDGQVSVDGTPLAPQSLLRCIPYSESDADLDLQVIGDGFVLFIYVNQQGIVSHELSIQGSAVGDGGSMGVFGGMASESPDGNWHIEFDQPALDGPPFEWSGDRVSGSLTLADAYEEADPIEVGFDVPVPPDVHDCSL